MQVALCQGNLLPLQFVVRVLHTLSQQKTIVINDIQTPSQLYELWSARWNCFRSTNGQHLFRLKGDCVVKPDTEVESDRYRNVSTTQMYILADIEPAELDSSRLRSIAKPYTPQTRYDAQFARLEELMKTI